MTDLQTKGLVMHSQAGYYDLLAWMLTLGREGAFRERLVEMARLKPGESVLDVGCGTGTQAIAAKRRVGATGQVYGIDASGEMIELAKKKATDFDADVNFQTAITEALPFPDNSFDVVFSTLMLHHLPRAAREQCAREIYRVLKPEGRVLAVDFAAAANKRKGVFAHLHRHGHMPLENILTLLKSAELNVVESGSVGVSDLHFALAAKSPSDSTTEHITVALRPLPMPRWILPAAILTLVAAHVIALSSAASLLTLSTIAIVGIAAVGMIMHLGFAGAIHKILRRH